MKNTNQKLLEALKYAKQLLCEDEGIGALYPEDSVGMLPITNAIKEAEQTPIVSDEEIKKETFEITIDDKVGKLKISIGDKSVLLTDEIALDTAEIINGIVGKNSDVEGLVNSEDRGMDDRKLAYRYVRLL